MKTELVRIDYERPLEPQVAPWGAVLRAGGLVAFPTETVYGLGGNGLAAAAAERIYAAKGRPSDNPLILHVTDWEMAAPLAREWPEPARKLAAAFWPGPLTLVLPKAAQVPLAVTGGGDTVALRAPDQPVAEALIRAAGVPLAGPSANRSGRPSPVTAEAVRRDLDGRIAAILDGGPCTIGVESTVVACTDERITIYRPGAITPEMLAEFAPTELDAALQDAAAIPKAPGMKYRHYAPKMPVYLYTGEPAAVAAEIVSDYSDERGYFVSRETAAQLPAQAHVRIWGARTDVAAMAASMYDSLLTLENEGVSEIYAEGVPATGLGLAVMNRLQKAAGYRIREVL
ncbi:MAG: threonylcarbamoyl-AMP synthase [Veillonellaceae bacterium]|nr:threonylcarbamoyl-AMP synthase [Veillonellaceae bacterium]